VADPRSDAYEAALSALSRRERTDAELTSWLERRGYGAAEIETAVTRLTEVGELDDERFARRYAEDKRELRGWGAERVREALLARGVPASIAESVAGGDSHQAQVGRAGELLAARGRPLADDADRAKALGYLTRRGYEYEIAHEAIRLASRKVA
jgi:regulatory protein